MLNTFENYLLSYDYQRENETVDAIRYSIENPGKRVRPMLLLTLLKDYGYPIEDGLSSALAIEMIHNFSLVHDDLPAMDNDDYRRGKLSTHKRFGEATAILAGDGLVSEAFKCIAKDERIDANKRIELVALLADYTGVNGMIYGQEIDLASENGFTSIEIVDEINRYKTSKLLTFPLVAAAIIADKQEDIDALIKLGTTLGIAFQIQDDIFDVSKSFEELGKMPESDTDNQKSNYVSLLGVEAAQVKYKELFDMCYQILDELKIKDGELRKLIDEILVRDY